MSTGPTTTEITAVAVVFLHGDPYAVRHTHCPACGRPVLSAECLDRDELRAAGLSYWSQLVLVPGQGEAVHPTVHLCPRPALL